METREPGQPETWDAWEREMVALAGEYGVIAACREAAAQAHTWEQEQAELNAGSPQPDGCTSHEERLERALESAASRTLVDRHHQALENASIDLAHYLPEIARQLAGVRMRLETLLQDAERLEGGIRMGQRALYELYGALDGEQLIGPLNYPGTDRRFTDVD